MEDLSSLATACHEHLDTVGSEIALMKWGSILVTVLAAVLAAATTKFERQKNGLAGAAVVMSGLSALVQVLPLDTARELHASAGAHSREGDRARVQVPTIGDDGYRASLDRYARSRYVDCVAVQPQATVPPLPEGVAAANVPGGGGGMVTESAAALQGERE